MATPVGPALYDTYGELIPVAEGAKTPAPIYVSERVDRYREYPTRRLTATRLTNILDEADQGWPDRYIQLCEEILEKDARIGSVFQVRTAAVLGTSWEIIPADETPEAEKYADFVREVFEACNIEELVANQLEAVAKPYAVSWIYWTVKDGRNTIATFRRVSQRRFRWSQDEDRLMLIRDPYDQQLLEIPSWSSVRSISNVRRDHPTRAGLLRPIAWLYFFKNVALKDWQIFNERFGIPVRTIKLPPGEFSNEAVLAQARTSLRDMGADASGIFTTGAEIEIKGVSSAGANNVFQALIEYVDRSISRAVLGHELTSQSSPGAGQLGVTAAREVRQDILEGDCEWVGKEIKRDVIVPLIGFNFGWEATSLAPKLSFQYEEPIDKMAEANTLSILTRRFPDLEISEQQVRERFDLAEPESPEDVLKAPVFEPFGGGGGFGDEVEPGEEKEEPDSDKEQTPKQPRVFSPERKRRVKAEIERRLARKVIASKGLRLPSPGTQREQREVKKIVDEGRSEAVESSERIQADIRKAVAASVEKGESAYELERRLTALGRKINVSELEKGLRDRLILARLAGRALIQDRIAKV